MLEPIVMRKGVRIVELGAGTGVFTDELAARLPRGGTLIAFENNTRLAQSLRERVQDRRIHIVEADAAEIVPTLRRFGLSAADYVVSGLPLGTMSPAARTTILLGICECLSDEGLFIQFQYWLTSLFVIRKYFRARIAGLVLKNLPPAFVYVCRKRAGSAPRPALRAVGAGTT
jgi:phospholipid N-methyltransferase